MLSLKIENVDNIKESNYTELRFSGECGVIRNEEDVIIGFFNINIYDSEIELETLEILEEYQFKGYGTAFLNELFDKYKSVNVLKGLSREVSTEFYANYGAQFHNTCEDCSVEECGFHPINDLANCQDEEVCDDYSDNYFVINRRI